MEQTFRQDMLQGRTALVTGGTSGIGLATARRLAGLGARVVAVGLGALPEANGDTIAFSELDVTDVAASAALVDSLDRLDILINAAGIGRGTAEHDPEIFARVIEVNLNAVLRISGLCRPRMAANGGGSIVNFSSVYASRGNGRAPAYASSKGAIDQLTQSLAIAYAEDGIRVNAVAPGWIDTPMMAPLKSLPGAAERVLSRTPMGRFGNPSDVADAIALLCSPAAGFITGAILPVDGGYLCV